MQTSFLTKETEPRFNGSDYVPARDNPRLGPALKRVKDLMYDGKWRTIPEIIELANVSPMSASRYLRYLKADRFGGFTVDKKYLGKGLYKYHLTGGQ